MADVMLDLARHIIGTKYEVLTSEAIDSAKKSILDTIGVTIAGSMAEGCKAVVDMVKEWGGKEESTIWIYGGKVPATLASLAIGPMARAWDFGDVHEATELHVTEYIIPAAFPIAERQGGVNGKDFITAIALAQDLMIRMESCIVLPIDISNIRYSMCTIFGVTAAVTKLLGLDEDKTWNAMGLAYAQAAGDLLQSYEDGALSWRVRHGFVADAAIKAALLAQKGITGPKNILQGKYGFYRLFAPEYNLEPLTAELGKRYEGANISLKSYSGCYWTHGAIKATIDCAVEHGIKPQDVEEINVGVEAPAHAITCEPKEIRYNPRNLIDIQFSLPYTVATAMVKGGVFIEDFTEDAMNRADVREIMRRIKTRVEPGVVSVDGLSGAAVTIKTKDGKEYSKWVYYSKGHPKNPMTMGDVIEKFRRCLPFSAKPLPEENSEEIIKMVSNLEEVDDVTKIIELLVP